MHRLIKDCLFPAFFFLSLGVAGCATTPATQTVENQLDFLESGFNASVIVAEKYNWLREQYEPTQKPEDITETPKPDNSKVQAIISKSKRIGSLKIPSDMKPTINIDGWNVSGAITFQSKTCGSGKVPATGGYEYFIETSDGSSTEDSASSHGMKDSRWNKFFGDKLKAFCVVLLKDNRRTIVEISECIER